MRDLRDVVALREMRDAQEKRIATPRNTHRIWWLTKGKTPNEFLYKLSRAWSAGRAAPRVAS